VAAAIDSWVSSPRSPTEQEKNEFLDCACRLWGAYNPPEAGYDIQVTTGSPVIPNASIGWIVPSPFVLREESFKRFAVIRDRDSTTCFDLGDDFDQLVHIREADAPSSQAVLCLQAALWRIMADRSISPTWSCFTFDEDDFAEATLYLRRARAFNPSAVAQAYDYNGSVWYPQPHRVLESQIPLATLGFEIARPQLMMKDDGATLTFCMFTQRLQTEAPSANLVQFRAVFIGPQLQTLDYTRVKSWRNRDALFRWVDSLIGR